MHALKEYLDKLSNKDKTLLIFSVSLLSIVFFKLFILDTLNKKNSELKARNVLIEQQKDILETLKKTPNVNSVTASPANKVITSFLKQNAISQQLKQIRTTNSGEQRFELEDIEFSKGVDLLGLLDKNGSRYSSIQIKNRKKTGLVNLIITIKN